MIDFKQLMDRKNNGSMKWDSGYIQKRFDVKNIDPLYPLFISDMDYQLDSNIMEQFQSYIQKGDFGYFMIQDNYYKAVIEWLKSQHQMDVQKNEIIPAPGTLAAIHLLMHALGKNKSTLVFTPVYGHFANAVEPFAPLITEQLQLNDGVYTIDFEAFERTVVAEKIAIVVFCNPHNPSGKNWCSEELQQLVNICQKHQVLLISDEIHADLTYTKTFTSLYQYMDEYENIVITTSSNKLFNLSGLSASYIVSKSEVIREAFSRFLADSHIEVNRVGLAFTEICYRNGEAWKLALMKQLQHNLDLTIKTLALPNVEIMKPDSGYLIWIKLLEVKDIDRFVLNLAKATGVLVETGSRFINNYQSWFRINIATNEETLAKALILLKDYINTYKE